ncbi:MAG: hypothetical protein JWN72_261 [Thermoleophilia bacterium]|nr:hypothetical protein [Thermoleophilia bacterium]MCW2971988.1 hypothetical protein [Thermoleophilia bacterium]
MSTVSSRSWFVLAAVALVAALAMLAPGMPKLLLPVFLVASLVAFILGVKAGDDATGTN